MGESESLGGLQLLVMLATLRLGDQAYGANLQEELETRAGRFVAISTIYVTMERLERRGLVTSWLGDPTPIRGGRAKRFYRLTDEGLKAAAAAKQELDRMWRGLNIDAVPKTP